MNKVARYLFASLSVGLFAVGVAQAGFTFNAGTDKTSSIGSFTVSDSTGTAISGQTWGDALPIGVRVNPPAVYLPARLLAYVRDDVSAGNSPDKTSILAWLQGAMGNDYNLPPASIDAQHLVALDLNSTTSEYCGSWVQSISHECEGSCTSNCGVGKDKCCNCACFGTATIN